MLVEPRHLDQLLHPTFENEKAYQRDVITRGLGASPGAAVGKLVFTAGESWSSASFSLNLQAPSAHCKIQLCRQLDGELSWKEVKR